MSSSAPPGWDKTLDDLFTEMKQGERLTVGSKELKWARDYERSLLPSNTVFPRGGQIWEVAQECDVQVNYVFATPASFSGKGRLPVGERVRIMDDIQNSQPILVSFLPLR